MAQAIKRENSPVIKREEERSHQNHGIAAASLPTPVDAQTSHQAFVKIEPASQGQVSNASSATSLSGAAPPRPPIHPQTRQDPAALSKSVGPQNGYRAFIKTESGAHGQVPNVPPALSPHDVSLGHAAPPPAVAPHVQQYPTALSTPHGPRIDQQASVKAQPSTQGRVSNALPAAFPSAAPTSVPPQTQQSRRQRQPKARPEALYIARSETSTNLTSTTDGIDPDVLKRIVGCLNRGDTARNTSESEAKTAVRMAHRLMMQHNIRESDMRKLSERQDRSGPVGGASTVRIVRPEKHAGKKVRGAGWHATLSTAVRIYFDVACYTIGDANLEYYNYTFYGLSMNTEVAAESFKTTFNIMQEWAVRRKGTGNADYLMGFAQELKRTAKRDRQAETVAAHGSEANVSHKAENPAPGPEQSHPNTAEQQKYAIYTNSPVDGHIGSSIKHEENGLDRDGDVQMGSEIDVKPTIKVEQDSQPWDSSPAKDTKQPIRLEDDDDDDDCMIIDADFIERREGCIVIDLTRDSDDETTGLATDGHDNVSDDGDDDANDNTSLNIINETATNDSHETADTTKEEPIAEIEQPQPKWSSALQLQRYRDDAETAKTNWIESRGIKLRKARSFRYTKRNREAFEEGRTHSRKVHLRHNRVENEEAMDQSD